MPSGNKSETNQYHDIYDMICTYEWYRKTVIQDCLYVLTDKYFTFHWSLPNLINVGTFTSYHDYMRMSETSSARYHFSSMKNQSFMLLCVNHNKADLIFILIDKDSMKSDCNSKNCCWLPSPIRSKEIYVYKNWTSLSRNLVEDAKIPWMNVERKKIWQKAYPSFSSTIISIINR